MSVQTRVEDEKERYIPPMFSVRPSDIYKAYDSFASATFQGCGGLMMKPSLSGEEVKSVMVLLKMSVSHRLTRTKSPNAALHGLEAVPSLARMIVGATTCSITSSVL